MGTLTDETKKFIQDHIGDDTGRLLLSAHCFPGIDVPFAVGQIEARRHIREKLPTWYANPDLIFPSSLAAEQCSSELTARYKRRLTIGDRACDLTGGLGVDAWQMAQSVAEMAYVERQPDYCEAAMHNFHVLGADNIRVTEGDATAIAASLRDNAFDTLFIDPARRAQSGKRLFALSDCEPDITSLKGVLLAHSRRVIVKMSPMADVSMIIAQLPETTEIHILSVRNECKEVIAVLEPDTVPSGKIRITAANLLPNSQSQPFTFRMEEERDCPSTGTQKVEAYLYEPNAALLKSGAFKLIAARYRLAKLHTNSHLYTSATPVPDFPGRQFAVEQVSHFSTKDFKALGRRISQANITVRNFPIAVSALRKLAGITDGGDTYLFATTLTDGERVIVECRKK